MNALSNNVNSFFVPVNNVLFQILPYIGLLILLLFVFYLLKKLVNSILYKRHKHDPCISTNKWWDWGEFKNAEKKKNNS